MSLKLLSEFLRQFRHRFCRPSLLCHYFSNYSYTTLRATIHIQQIAAAAIASEESAAAGQGGRREESERASESRALPCRRRRPSPPLPPFSRRRLLLWAYGAERVRTVGGAVALLRPTRYDFSLVSPEYFLLWPNMSVVKPKRFHESSK